MTSADFTTLWFDTRLSRAEIAAQAGVTLHAVRVRAWRMGLPGLRLPHLAADTKAGIVEMYRAGESWDDIAEAAGVERRTVGRVVRAAGLPLRSEARA